jgi:hypothetical protein
LTSLFSLHSRTGSSGAATGGQNKGDEGERAKATGRSSFRRRVTHVKAGAEPVVKASAIEEELRRQPRPAWVLDDRVSRRRSCRRRSGVAKRSCDA